MTKLVSPGVYVREIDLSEFIPAPIRYGVDKCGVSLSGENIYRIFDCSPEVKAWIANTLDKQYFVDIGRFTLTESEVIMLMLKFPLPNISPIDPGQWVKV
jgi:hypothetical protein